VNGHAVMIRFVLVNLLFWVSGLHGVSRLFCGELAYGVTGLFVVSGLAPRWGAKRP
jgi:hypothetical protein